MPDIVEVELTPSFKFSLNTTKYCESGKDGEFRPREALSSSEIAVGSRKSQGTWGDVCVYVRSI